MVMDLLIGFSPHQLQVPAFCTCPAGGAARHSPPASRIHEPGWPYLADPVSSRSPLRVLSGLLRLRRGPSESACPAPGKRHGGHLSGPSASQRAKSCVPSTNGLERADQLVRLIKLGPHLHKSTCFVLKVLAATTFTSHLVGPSPTALKN